MICLCNNESLIIDLVPGGNGNKNLKMWVTEGFGSYKEVGQALKKGFVALGEVVSNGVKESEE